MIDILDDKIHQCQMWANLFKQIKDRYCEELGNCVAYDLGAESVSSLAENRMWMENAKSMYDKLNAPAAKTRNWLIANPPRHEQNHRYIYNRAKGDKK